MRPLVRALLNCFWEGFLPTYISCAETKGLLSDLGEEIPEELRGGAWKRGILTGNNSIESTVQNSLFLQGNFVI